MFDNPETRRLTEARMEFITPLIHELLKAFKIESAMDIGCGMGDFSLYLSQFGFPNVLGVDGRAENIAEARRRHPQIRFLVADAEDFPAENCTSDLVLCFGLLYHLENPFRAIRRLYTATKKVLLIESMCSPGDDPSMKLVDEYPVENQGINHVGFYPTESCLAKMLYRAGFPFVYTFKTLPDHLLFHASLWRRKERTMLAASKVPLNASALTPALDVYGSWEILSKPRERLRMRLSTLREQLRTRFGRWLCPQPHQATDFRGTRCGQTMKR